MKRSILLLFLLVIISRWSLANHYVPYSDPYEDNMTLTGVILVNGVEQQSTALEVGVFCGEECRGSGMPTYFPPTQRYIIQLIIYGESGDQLTFKLYNHDTNMEMNVESPAAVTFGANGYGSLMNPYSLDFVAVVTNYEITAVANPTAGGTVSGAGTYEEGATATLTATPNSGYTFQNWTQNGTVVSTNSSYSFTVTATGNYVANFSLNNYQISATANPTVGGTVTGSGSYNHGTTATLTATPNSGYTFQNWTQNGTVVSTNASYSFTVTATGNYVANFLSSEPPVVSDVVITINPGWNWISYLMAEETPIEEALIDLIPSDGDLIKSQTQYSVYHADTQTWDGSLDSFIPGQGYMYLSRSNVIKYFVYPSVEE